MAVGIVQIDVAPAPGHHLRHFGEIEAGLLQLAAEIIELGDFEIEADAFAGDGIVRAGLMESDCAVVAGGAEAGVDGFAFVAEIFDEFEAEEVVVEAGGTLDILDVDHGVIEGEFSGGGCCGGGFRGWALCGTLCAGFFCGGFFWRSFFHCGA